MGSMPPFNNSMLPKEGIFVDHDISNDYMNNRKHRCLSGDKKIVPKENFDIQDDISPLMNSITIRSNSDGEKHFPEISFKGNDNLKALKPSLKKSASMPVYPSRDMTADNTNVVAQRTIRKKTSFSTLEIREYNLTAGDNPGGQSGTPISISWEFDKENVQLHDVDSFERQRPPRRTEAKLYLSPRDRFLRLLQHGCSVDEMLLAAKEAQDVRNKRSKTNTLNSFTTISMQQALRCSHKKIKCVLKFKPFKAK